MVNLRVGIIRLNSNILSPIWVLSLVFILSFVPYMSPYYTQLQFLAPALLMLLAILLGFKYPSRLIWTPTSLFSILAFPLLLLPGVIGSLDAFVVFNWALLWMVLLSVWIIGRNLSLQEVLEAFANAGAICALITLIGFLSNVQVVQNALAGTRMTLWYFHPNLLAFALTGFGLAQPLFSSSYRRRLFGWIICVFCLVAVFLLSSRSSLVAYLLAPLITTLVLLRTQRFFSTNAKKIALVTSLGVLALAIIAYFLAYPQKISQIAVTVDKALYLSNQGRGLASGGSGRIEVWQQVIHDITSGAWLLGIGYRKTSLDLIIDNGYLVLLYENGIIASFLYIALLFSQIVRAILLGKRNVMRPVAWTFAMLSCAFLINNFAARYLLGIGNPYSLLMLLLITDLRMSPKESTNLKKSHSKAFKQNLRSGLR